LLFNSRPGSEAAAAGVSRFGEEWVLPPDTKCANVVSRIAVVCSPHLDKSRLSSYCLRSGSRGARLDLRRPTVAARLLASERLKRDRSRLVQREHISLTRVMNLARLSRATRRLPR
jgi:hypothetical protein